MTQVTVVGAGLAGLACAVALADGTAIPAQQVVCAVPPQDLGSVLPTAWQARAPFDMRAHHLSDDDPGWPWPATGPAP